MNMMTDNEYMPLDASQPAQNDQEERQGKKNDCNSFFLFFFCQSGCVNISILRKTEKEKQREGGSFESRQSGGE